LRWASAFDAKRGVDVMRNAAMGAMPVTWLPDGGFSSRSCGGTFFCMQRVWAYVFVETENPGPKRVVREIRRLEGVIRADALLGTPDIIAIVEGGDIAEMDAVIDRIAELPGVLDTESKVARWID
jgi:AsnC-like helix-turn-helix protein